MSGVAHYSVSTLSDAAGGVRFPSLSVMLAYVRACGGDCGVWEARWREAAAEVTAGCRSEAENAACPYAGLAAFGSGDADRFFGRDRVVEDLVTRLRERRFLGVFGASGAGKSSVLRAGVAARAMSVGLSGAGPEPVLVFTPGPHPVEECAIQLAAFTGESATVLRAELAADASSLHLWIRQRQAARTCGADVLVVVDQFEELFTLCHDPAEQAQFIAALVEAANAARSRTRVVIGVRADFYGHCGQHPALIEALTDRQVLIGPMSPEELTEAITRPAKRAGCTVDTALVARLVFDAAGQPCVLPLISHALAETWRRRQATRLTVTGYEATGGIHHAIGRTAEDVYRQLDPADQRAARQLFGRLITVGETTEPTRRRVTRHELATAVADSTAVLDTLAHNRLVTLDADTAEITHEALVRHWPRLHDWLAEDRHGLRIQQQLTDAAATWTCLDHDPGALYRGTRLTQARDWAAGSQTALTTSERQFLHASLTARTAEQKSAGRRTRRLCLLAALLTALLLAVPTATAYAVHNRRLAANEHKITMSVQILKRAAGLRNIDPDLARQLTLAAYRLAPTTQETRDALLSISLTVHHHQTLSTPGVTAIAIGSDGHTLASNNGTTTTLWELTDNLLHDHPLGTIPGAATSLAFSPDVHTVAVAGTNRTPELWDLTNPHLPMALGVTGTWTAAVFSANGKILATTYTDHTLQLRDISDRTKPRRLTTAMLPDDVTTVAISNDGKILATTNTDHTVQLWDTDTTNLRADQPLATLSGAGQSVTFSPDGYTLATADTDNTVRLWNITNPHNPTTQTTLTGYAVNTANQYNDTPPPTGQPPRISDQTDTPHLATALTFSPDGHTLTTADRTGTTRTWQTDTKNYANQLCDDTTAQPITETKWHQHLPDMPYQPPCP
jgi:hypothetical protein